MNAQPPNSADEEKIVRDILFEDHPEIRAFLDSMNEAKAKFSASMNKCENEKGGHRIACAWKCLMELCRNLESAKKTLGLKNDAEPSLISKVLSDYDRRAPRQLSLGEKRAIRVAAFYQAGFRPDFVGAKDTPMEAALQVAACLEGLPLDTGPETIRKSIQRFRKSIVGEEMFKLDRAKLEWEVHRAEDVLLNGLPNRPGRPRKKQGQIDR
jgi:hypothetical protein